MLVEYSSSLINANCPVMIHNIEIYLKQDKLSSVTLIVIRCMPVYLSSLQ